MLEIAIASGKGGVGKSTVAATIALILRKRGVKVIAVDADADAPNLHLILGVSEWKAGKPYSEGKIAEIDEEKCIGCGACMNACTYGAVESLPNGKYSVVKLLCEGCLTCSLVCPIEGAIRRLDTEAGETRVAETGYGFPLVSARLRPGRPNSGRLVTEVKSMAKEMASEDSVILIDSAAGIGCQVIASLAGANLAVLVAEPTPASFSDLKRVHALTKHFMQPAVLVINKCDLYPEYLEVLEKYAEENEMEIVGRVPYDDAVPRSMALMKPMVEAFPDSPASKALTSAAERIYEIIGGWDEWFMEHKPRKPEPYKPIIIRPQSK